jgi:hypothetical protein
MDTIASYFYQNYSSYSAGGAQAQTRTSVSAKARPGQILQGVLCEFKREHHIIPASVTESIVHCVVVRSAISLQVQESLVRTSLHLDRRLHPASLPSFIQLFHHHRKSNTYQMFGTTTVLTQLIMHVALRLRLTFWGKVSIIFIIRNCCMAVWVRGKHRPPLVMRLLTTLIDMCRLESSFFKLDDGELEMR